MLRQKEPLLQQTHDRNLLFAFLGTLHTARITEAKRLVPIWYLEANPNEASDQWGKYRKRARCNQACLFQSECKTLHLLEDRWGTVWDLRLGDQQVAIGC